MKKIMVFLVILLILGGTGFFLGWVQLKVPLGSYGIIRSKTHGIDPQVVMEGEFRWVWYKLIPTNVEIRIFSPKTVKRTVQISGSLESGAIYAAVAGITADFSWKISGGVSFSIRPEALPTLTERENLNSEEDLSALEDDYAQRIETLIQNRLAALAGDEKNREAVLLTGTLPGMTPEIEASFPELEKVNSYVKIERFPDMALYQSVREIYAEYLASQQRFLQGRAVQNAEIQLGTRLTLDTLEKYGEILTRYPILLQFLALSRELDTSLFSGE